MFYNYFLSGAPVPFGYFNITLDEVCQWLMFRCTFSAMISYTLHKKWSFPLRISSVNVTKSAGNFFLFSDSWVMLQSAALILKYISSKNVFSFFCFFCFFVCFFFNLEKCLFSRTPASSCLMVKESTEVWFFCHRHSLLRFNSNLGNLSRPLFDSNETV